MCPPWLTEEADGGAPLVPRDGNPNGQLIKAYLLENVPEFRKLSEMRQKGWSNPLGDEYFQKQRQTADYADEDTSKFFHAMMLKIARELHRANTKAFTVSKSALSSGERPMILDTCMAPGGFLEEALCRNPESRAIAFSLPVDSSGHEIRLPSDLLGRTDVRLLDITMLAEDMGVDAVPHDHPEADLFLPRQLEAGQLFDLVFCDGQVLRTHARAPYREPREARRLTTTQLALGLEHLRPGGTMTILMHRAEAWDSVCLMRRFRQFSRVRFFKPWSGHARRSSFYMVATAVRSRDPAALAAIARWKHVWRVATFGSDGDYSELLHEADVSAEELLAELGPDLVRMGKHVWRVQATSLAKASFVRDQE